MSRQAQLLVWEVLLELFEEHEREYGVRSETNEGGREAFEKAGRADLEHVAETMQDACVLAGPGVHEPGLEHVERHGDGRGDDAGAQRGREVRHQIVGEPARAQQLMLDLVVEGELSDRDEHAARRRHRCAREHTRRALLPVDARQRLYAVLVVAALIQRQLAVVLHAHVHQIRWCTNNAFFQFIFKLNQV